MPGIGPWLLLPLNNPPKVEERGQKLDGPWKVARRDRLQVEGGVVERAGVPRGLQDPTDLQFTAGRLA